MSAERDKPSDLERALHEARRVLRGAAPTLGQRAVALSVIEEIDRALVAASTSPGEGSVEPSALDRERAVRVDAEGAQRRTEFLSQATGALFEAPLDADARALRLVRLAVPDLADWCVCDMAFGPRARRVAVGHWNPDGDVIVPQIVGEYDVDEQAAQGLSAVLRTGRSELVSDLATTPRTDPQDGAFTRLLATLSVRSYLLVPVMAAGRVLGALGFFFAESSRRYNEADLRLAEDLARRFALAHHNAELFAELARAVSSREEMIAVVSHDLRNPLSSIKLAGGLLQSSEPDGKNPRSKSSIILRSVGRMETLLRDLLDAAAIDAGKLTIAVDVVQGETLVAEAIEASEAPAREKGLRITRDVERGLELRADAGRLLQVFGNLLGNATKFGRAGDTIHVALGREGDFARITVADTGPGIPPDRVDHVFDRFWQGREKRHDGAGLGLAIAKGIVEAHGGRIAVASTFGAGATFTFTVPLATA